MKKILFLIIAFLLVLYPTFFAAFADEEPVEISMNTMIMFALDENPDLDIMRAKKEQMEYFVKEAQADFYPKIEAKAEGGREYISPANGSKANNLGKTSVTLNQNVFDGFQTTAEVSRRKELIHAAGIDVETQKMDLILEVVGHYLHIIRFSQLADRTEIFVKEVSDIVNTVSDMVEVGAASKAMLDYARSREASAYVNLNEAQSSLNDALSSLEFLTGPLPDFEVTVPDYLNPSKLDKELYVDKASTDSVLMRKVQSEIDAMKLQVEVEEGGFYPTLGFAMKAEQTHDDGGDIGDKENVKATLSLTYELFDGFERRNRLGRVNTQLKELEHKERKIFNALKRDIDLLYNQISSIQEALKATEAEISSNRALQRLNRENFRLGEINVIELIEGEERLQTAYTRKYKLENDLYQNIYTLLINSSILKEHYFCETCSEAQEY